MMKINFCKFLNSQNKCKSFNYSNLPPRYVLPRYELPVWYALFSRKMLCSKCNFFFTFNLKKNLEVLIQKKKSK